jgi:hypothetical protein
MDDVLDSALGATTTLAENSETVLFEDTASAGRSGCLATTVDVPERREDEDADELEELLTADVDVTGKDEEELPEEDADELEELLPADVDGSGTDDEELSEEDADEGEELVEGDEREMESGTGVVICD